MYCFYVTYCRVDCCALDEGLSSSSVRKQMVALICTVNIGLEMKHLRLPITKQTVASGAYQTPAQSGSIDLHFKIIASR